jgi:hypothetical protein
LRDPLFTIDPIDRSEYYDEKPAPPGGWPKRTRPSLQSENKLHTNLRNLVIEKDRIIEQGNCLVAELKKERRWRNILMTALGTTWAVLIYVLKLLVPYAIKGMMR